MAEQLLIVGGTARAAAHSAKRAGFAPLALDRYGDADLLAVCQTHCEIRHITEACQAAPQFAGIPWIFTGPVENYADVVASLCDISPLLGCSAAAVRSVRDPFRVAQALRAASLLAPQVVCGEELPRRGKWLRKPVFSSGGARIAPIALDGREPLSDGQATYLQQRIAGLTCGATFVADGNRAKLIGVCEQLIGESWTGCSGFHYAGSIGPLDLSVAQRRQLVCVGNCLAQNFRLRGLFGVDVILNADGVWPVEVNPRYTASVEILERALSFAGIAAHVTACRAEKLPEIPPVRSDVVCGKAIVYATRQFTVSSTDARTLLDSNDANSAPRIADLPKPGTTIRTGQPVVSVFADGGCMAEVKDRLRERGMQVSALLRC